MSCIDVVSVCCDDDGFDCKIDFDTNVSLLRRRRESSIDDWYHCIALKCQTLYQCSFSYFFFIFIFFLHFVHNFNSKSSFVRCHRFQKNLYFFQLNLKANFFSQFFSYPQFWYIPIQFDFILNRIDYTCSVPVPKKTENYFGLFIQLF